MVKTSKTAWEEQRAQLVPAMRVSSLLVNQQIRYPASGLAALARLHEVPRVAHGLDHQERAVENNGNRSEIECLRQA